MSIEAELRQKLTQAMKAKDSATANCIRMVKTKVMEKRTSKGFKGEVNDAVYVEVIGAYKKSLEKAQKEFENAGDKGKEQIDEMQFEIVFLKQYLPQELSEEEVRTAVKAAIDELGVSDPKMSGRVMGHVMKQHKGRVGGDVVKKIVAELLG